MEGASTAESQRREIVEDLVAVIAAQSREKPARPSVQAPPPRPLPSPANPPAGEAQRRPPPDGYGYATFERAGTPTQSADTGDEATRFAMGPDWLSSPESLASVAANAESAGRDWSFGWVRLGADARPDDATAALTALGVVVEGQAGDLLRARLPGDPDQLRAVAALPAVEGLGTQPPAAKLPPAFAEEAHGKPAHEIVPVFVTLAASGDTDGRWRTELERLGAVVGSYDADTRSYVANVEYGGLEVLAAADFVVFVEPVGIIEAANDTAAPAMGGDAYRTYTDAESWAGTAGQGVAIGVMDTGLNINHLDIESGRLSVCGANFIATRAEEQDLWVDAGGHGTHVTATIAGNGAAEPRYAGMAPLVPHIRFAKVLHSRGSGTESSILPGMEFLAEASACGAAGWTDDAIAPPIVNMSLSRTGRIWEGRDAAARKLDAVVWDTGQLYVVANSNANVHGFSNYGAAKSSLSVGATWDSGELASFSSHGPTADGRLAPLVVGTGVNVHSALGGGSRGAYRRLNGTSMSSPTVAGIAALVMAAQPDFAGKSALTRAHLMSSAVKPDAWLEARDAFPSDNTDGPGGLHARYGLGKVSGSTSVFDRPQNDGWESGGWHGISLDAGETSEHVIDVPSGASRLDVVLTWDEPPADVIANTVLNDLDLRLKPPFGALHGDLTSQSRRDNVEWVIVRSPRTGRWRVRVEAERVHGEKPRAALAYTIIRGSSTPKLSITADSDTLDANGGVELTVSTEGYVAAGTRLVMDCRTQDDEPCHAGGTFEEVRDDAPASGPQTINPGSFVALGEIRAGNPRTLRVAGLRPDGNARMHFTVTGWNAKGDSAVVFAADEEDREFVAPDNDDFANAAELDDRVEGDLLTATTESGEPAFEDGSERPAASVWYRWKAEADGPVHFSLVPGEAFRLSPEDDSYEAFETRVDVYSGDSIAGAREFASAPWGASFLAEEGTEYLLRVAGRSRAVPFSLSWRQGGSPDNDAFDASIALEGGEGQVDGTNAGATLEAGEQFGPLAATVWYEWTAPDDGWYGFASSAAHLKLLAFRDGASVGDLRLVSGFPTDDIRFLAKAGDTYRVAVAAQDAESAGTDFELSWSAIADPGSRNDLLENRYAFGDAESSRRWVRVESFYTVEPGEPAESGVRTGWHSWTAPAGGEYTWRLDTDFVRLTAFKGDMLDNLVPVGANVGPTGEFSFEADEGQPHRFSVAVPAEHAYTTRTPGAYVAWGPTPSNDSWSRAVVLDTAAGTFAASNRYATIETGERIHDVGHSSLWWSFEAPAPGWYRFWIDETAAYTLSAYTAESGAPPGRLDMIASSERPPLGTEVFLHAEDVGETFAVRVGTLRDAEGGEFMLNWEESDQPVWLRYLGRTADPYEHVDDDGEAVEVRNFRSLALDGTGRALYAATEQGLAVFDRNGDDGLLSFVDLIRGESFSRLLWDAPRNRLLVFSGGSSVRSYVPTAGDVLDLEDEGDVLVAAGAPELNVDINYTTVVAHPAGSFLYFVSRYHDLAVFSIGEDGTLAPVERGSRHHAVAVSNSGGHVYAVWSGTLHVFESGAAGELTEVASLRVPHAHEGVAVTDDDSRVFTLGTGGSAVVDVEDPTRPALLGTVGLPQQGRAPVCRLATARAGRTAADAFCTNGDAYALAWHDGKLAVTDLVADWSPNRYNDVVPGSGTWYTRPGFAASPDGRHAYASTPAQGIAVFERVGNGVPDDHADSRDTATPVASLPWSGAGELEREGDRDVFRIEVDGPGMLTIRTTGTTDTYGKLLDTTGAVLAEDDDSGDEPNFEIKTDVDAGTYYVEVSGAGGEETGLYTLSIEFEADTVVITADLSPIVEGMAADFTLTRSDSAGPLTVNVEVTETGAMVDGTAPTAVTFDDGQATAALSLGTEDDGVDEAASEVTVAVASGDGYSPGSRRAATVTVNDNDGPVSVPFVRQRVVTMDADAPLSVYAADLDGDGDPDVLSASYGDDKIAWYENLGGGTFSAQRVVTTAADGARWVHAADVDGDGDADVLSASQDDHKIAWHENLGGGTFSAQRRIGALSLVAQSVHAADVDGDGDADVLSASWPGKIAWHENLDGKSFLAEQIIHSGEGIASSVHAVDVDGDGDADVLSASTDDKIAWHENEGGGTFSARRVITKAAYGAYSVHAADVDGDGDADVLSASWGDDKIAWYENLYDHGDDHGDASDATATFATALPAFLHGVVESRGDRDVFRFATGRGTLRVYSNGPTDTYGTLLDADGTQLATNDDAGSGSNFSIETEVEAGVHYVEVRHFSTGGTGAYTLSVEFESDDAAVAVPTVTIAADASSVGEGAPADFTLTRSGSAGALTVNVEVTETGAMIDGTAPATVTFANGATTAALSVATVDDAVDESDSVVTATVAAGTGYTRGSPATATVTVADDDDPVTFAQQRVITTDADGAHSVQAVDLDGDGDADVLFASRYDDEIAWYENLGGGEFRGKRVITTDAGGAMSVHAVDFDGDGDADVLSASSDDNKVAWYENWGGGEFSPQRTITTDAHRAGSVHAADLDGDGDADVLSASQGDDKVAWYENLGGEFSAQRVIATDADSARSVHAADLDGDGDADVLCASYFDDKIAWYENLGGGEFSAQRVVTTDADGALSVHAADLDADGDADVLTGSRYGDMVAWHQNLGGGEFSGQRAITTSAGGAYSVHAADLDGDGDTDVLSASHFDDKVAWHENLGGGEFSSRVIGTGDASSVFAADLDGDGDADVLSALFGDDKIVWLENLSGHGDDHGDAADATATFATALPAFLHGTLESGGDRDVFRFATGGGTLRVYSTGPTDTYGTLLDADGGELASNDDGGSEVNFSIGTEVAAGVHYVEVRGYSNATTGPYTMSIEFVADSSSGGPTFARSFDLDDEATRGAGITYADGRFYLLDQLNEVFAYSHLGQSEGGVGSLPCCSYTGITYDDDRFYVVVSTETQVHRVYAYRSDWQRDNAAGFDLHDDNTGPRGITHANGRLYVVDALNARVYGYPYGRQRDAARDVAYFDLDPANGRPYGIAYANDRFYVVDADDGKVYAYRSDGQRDATADFNLHADNGDPKGIAYVNGEFHIVDYGSKVFTYSDPRVRRDSRPLAGFDLDDDNGNALGITHADGRFYVVDLSDEVFAYFDSGRRDARSDFSLRFVGGPAGIVQAGGRFYVVDAQDDDVYAYRSDGQRDAGADFDLAHDNDRPGGIGYANGRFYVVDAGGKVYAYGSEGQRDAAADFDLHVGNGNPAGIVYAVGRFYVTDAQDNRVYAYWPNGQYDSWSDFDLDEGNGNASGIVYVDNQFYVADRGDGKVYAYSGPMGSFALDAANDDPTGITYADSRFYVVDTSPGKVFAYRLDGQRDATLDFDLRDGNTNPEGITYAEGRFYIPDQFYDKVYAYRLDGQRDAASDFDLFASNDSETPRGISLSNNVSRSIHVLDRSAHVYNYDPNVEPTYRNSYRLLPEELYSTLYGVTSGTTFAGDRLYVITWHNDKAYAYWRGLRNSVADFDLGDGDDIGQATGITYADGRFYVVDAWRGKVHVLVGPADPDGPR